MREKVGRENRLRKWREKRSEHVKVDRENGQTIMRKLTKKQVEKVELRKKEKVERESKLGKGREKLEYENRERSQLVRESKLTQWREKRGKKRDDRQ